MPVAQAVVATASARKYMIQLCKHWSHKLDVTWDDQQGRIVFDPNRTCALAVAGAELTLNVETANEEELERTKQTVISHLKRFAFREEFGDISWTRVS